MKQDYKLIKETFFNSYKSFVDFIMLTYTEPSMYNILVLRKSLDRELSKVTIVIRNSNNNDKDSYQEFVSNMILSEVEAINLIDEIREDFKENHVIAYSSINTHSFIQTMQNTKFSLNIKLNSMEEVENAMCFNNKINSDPNRNLVLTRN